MSETTLTVSEFFMALLHREPVDWEVEYWGNELAHTPLENVIRRMTSYDEHKRFFNDRRQMFVPAGHFYSPIVDQDFVEQRWKTIYSRAPKDEGLDLNERKQIEFLNQIKVTAKKLPFTQQKSDGLRYYYDNGAFQAGDAIVYAAMLDKFRPKRIAEIGSGFSSALALDVCELLDNYEPEFRFIDPYPQLAHDLTGNTKSQKVTIRGDFIQDVDPGSFEDLESGDFYFMDTTHIVKTGSDVPYHFEKILPRLKSGVILHLHDVFYPFEYPPYYVFDVKASWNELYYFRAFMVNNAGYEILFFNSYMNYKYRDLLLDAAPAAKQNTGASIWFRKR